MSKPKVRFIKVYMCWFVGRKTRGQGGLINPQFDYLSSGVQGSYDCIESQIRPIFDSWFVSTIHGLVGVTMVVNVS